MIQFIILGLLLLSFNCYSFDKTVRFAATDWCPYSCKAMANGGFAYKKIKKVLSLQGISMSVEYFPWSRAINLVRSGRYDALLTAVPSEANDLIYTTTPTMTYQNCIFKIKNKSSFQNINKFKKYKMGITADYSYGEKIDDYIKKHSSDKRKIIKIGGDDTTKRLISLLITGRIDYFVEDVKTVSLHTYVNLEKAYCSSEIPFFIGISPKFKNSTKLKTILNQNL